MFYETVNTGLGAPTDLLFTSFSFRRVKRLGHEIDHSPSSSAFRAWTGAIAQYIFIDYTFGQVY